jgi:hypothetical protein
MLDKIVSGGQTGADQAALDVAIEFDIPHGGWMPKGRITESGPLPDKYNLQEMPTASYPERTEQNVIDSDGTLIISHGPLAGGSDYTKEMAVKHDRPCLHIDLDETNTFQAALDISNWMRDNEIKTLNVAGPRASKDSDIYDAVFKLLESAIILEQGNDTPSPAAVSADKKKPETVAETVDQLINDMSLRDKVAISKLSEDDLVNLHFSLGLYIRNRFLYPRNDKLLEDCRRESKDKFLHWDQASKVIIRQMWNELKKTHKLRVMQ